MKQTNHKDPARPRRKPATAETVHPLSPVMEAVSAVLKNTARRIDLAVTLDGEEYKVVVYRQLDKVVRCEFKSKST